MTNSPGVFVSREADMAAYDALPPAARLALANAHFDWAVEPIYSRWRRKQRGFTTPAAIAKTIRRRDLDRVRGR